MSTPLMRQYQQVKAKHPETVLLFRMGDFFETFEEDAKIASRVLGITLTRRGNGAAGEVPLAGFPHHALEAYLPKLVAEAFRDPAKFRSGLPPKWEALKLGEHLAYLGYYEQAIAHFDLFLKEDPGEPAIHLRIAYMRLVDRDAEGGLRSLHRAYLADPYFIRGYSGAAFACFGRGDLETAERVIRAGLRQEPGFTDLKVGLGRILLAQAKKMLGTDPGEARKRYAEIAALELPPEIEQQLRKGWEEAQSPPASGGGGPPGLPPGHGSGGHGH